MTIGKDPHLAQRIDRALRGTNAAAERRDRLAARQGAKPARDRKNSLTDHLGVFSPVATLGKLFRR